MGKMINQFANKTKGQFSFSDQMSINGYFRPLLLEQTWIGFLYSIGIPLRDFTQYFKNVTECLLKQIESDAKQLGHLLYTLLPPRSGKKTLLKISFFQSL